MLAVDLGRPLADTLWRLRAEAGLTQAEMARRLKVSRPTITRLESASQNTTLATLSQVCRALRCEPGDLFKGGRGRLVLRAKRRRREDT